MSGRRIEHQAYKRPTRESEALSKVTGISLRVTCGKTRGSIEAYITSICLGVRQNSTGPLSYRAGTICFSLQLLAAVFGGV